MDRSRQLATIRNAVIVGRDGVLGGTMKAILRCIDDHGATCWASYSTLATESCFNRRTVIRAVKALEHDGYITATGDPGKTTSYRVNFDKLNQCQVVTGDKASPVAGSHCTGDRLSETSDRPSPKAVEADLSGSEAASTQEVEEAFEVLWKVYPPRDGRKLGKKQALAEFRKTKPKDWPLVMNAVQELSISGQLPKDCHRWLRNSIWREWLPSPMANVETSQAKSAGRGRSLIEDEEGV